MDTDETLFSIPINPTNFPAKLWQLVNNTTITAIHWDSSGEHVVIEQNLFEKQFLDPEKKDLYDNHQFKTNNFASFIRQMNLYGFRKVIYNKLYHGLGVHHYLNPNFKRGHPERLVLLKRLTVSNKAKIEAGIEVPSRRHRYSNGDSVVTNKNDKKEIVQTKGAFHPTMSQPTREYNGTPVPPRNWMIHKGDAPSPQMFYTKSGIPIPVFSRYSGEASSLAHIQQGCQGYASPSPEFSSFIPRHAQYPSGFYSSGYQFQPPGPVSPGGCLHCYQPNYPISLMFPGNHCRDSQVCEYQNMKRNDINLDRVFQLVDELDEGRLQSHVVKVNTPEKLVCKPPTSMGNLTVETPSANSALASSSQADTAIEIDLQNAIKQEK